MSRPESRVSARPSTSLGLHGHSSTNSAASSSTRPLGGLSQKQYDQIASNISNASARKSHPAKPPSHLRRSSSTTHAAAPTKAEAGSQSRSRAVRMEAEEDYLREGLSSSDDDDQHPIAAAAAMPPGSFVPSAQFAAAPVNSRVPPASPRRVSSATTTNQQPRASTSKQHSPLALDAQDDLSGASTQIQEALLVEDLLSVLIGIEGHVITFDEDYVPEDEHDRFRGARFAVDQRIEPALRHLASRIVPLATYYTAIDAFVNKFSHLEYGLVNHSLCAAMRDHLQRYLALVAHLEHLFATAPTFTLQRFWLFVQDALRTLSLIAELTAELLESPQQQHNDMDASHTDSSSNIEDESDAGGLLADDMKAFLGQMKPDKPTWASGGLVKGGEVLAVLEERIQATSGDPTAYDLYTQLLLSASQPYVHMLVAWISAGNLQDPHEEFMIRESRSINRGSLDQDFNDEYWESRYTLRDSGAAVQSVSVGPESPVASKKKKKDRSGEEGASKSRRRAARERGLGGGAIVPAFLERWKAHILLAGKYLNVIRECGLKIEVPEDVVSSKADDSKVVINSDAFYNRIKAAYTYANKTLLRLLLEDKQLLLRLKSIKQNFFIDLGDSYTQFLDLASQELAKKVRHVSEPKLQGYLDVAIRNPSSSSSTDPFKEDIKVKLENSDLTEWLTHIANVDGALGGTGELAETFEIETKARDDKGALLGIDALSLDYVVAFPLSLVISKNAILRYQLIFRHLLSLKQIELGLAHLWLEQSKSPLWRDRTPYPELERFKFRVMALRARMLATVKELYGFTVSEVLEPNWIALQKKMLEAETVDVLLRQHIDFLDTCLKECMLTMSRLLKHRNKLLHSIKVFRGHYGIWTNHIRTALMDAEENGGDWSAVDFGPAYTLLNTFESHFKHWSELHAESVQYQASSESVALLPLVYRLMALNEHQA